MNKKNNTVAVVTGASKGIGKGIALVLGQQGATVYVTGRNLAPLEIVASQITRRGGRGIAVVCDMADDTQIASLFETVKTNHGYLNILVNNATALSKEMVIKPFWEATVHLADILEVGLRSHHIASWHAAPLLLASHRGLLVNISFYADAKIHDPAYYASKAGLDKLAASYGEHFEPFNVTPVSLWPGFVATEAMLDLVKSDNEMRKTKDRLGFESPEYCGLMVKSLYNDPNLKSFSGKTLLTAELGEHYGIVDIDSHKPKSLRHVFGAPLHDKD